jgi:lipopolysaccharide transport system ATP-binding protein
MSDVAIRAENLGKKYRIRHQQAERYTALRDVIAEKFWRSFRSRGPVSGEPPAIEDFWALKDVSFEVKCGEVIGIIGRNGAGKSTLLKILSRITEPTGGRVELSGRVACLLEVGTGFHPELTGRENIYLNGAVLGMARAEIRRKFDDIVAFAEVERFLDTPVKRYSSGMYVRLAFAVAAHLEHEILIVDEVLAVGDTQFQKKCLGKMEQVAQKGRTVLFVSHNMAAIRALCHRGILLEQGTIVFDGDADRCIREYGNEKHGLTAAVWTRPAESTSRDLRFTQITAELMGRQPNHILRIVCSLAGEHAHRPALLAFDISDALGTPLMQALPAVDALIKPNVLGHKFRFDIHLPPLVPGEYRVSAWAGPHHNETFDFCRECISFNIQDSPTPNRTFPHTRDHGFLVPACTYANSIE